MQQVDAGVFARRESKVRSYSRSFGAVFERASGSEMFDVDGRRYLDFLAGCSSLNYGHNDPDLKAALLAHVEADTLNHGLDLFSVPKARFLEAMERIVLAPRGLPHLVQFTGPTGTNAVEAAIKLARSVTGRTNVIAFTNGFHGVTAGALAATGNQHHRMGPEQPLGGVTRALYDGYAGPDVDTADLLATLLDDPSSGYDPPAAILLETVQGEGGLNAASPHWLRKIEAIARKHGALLIVDDIQAGCGRTGNFFSFEESGIVPDLVTLSKSLSGYGLPLAVLLVHPDIDEWAPGQHNGTFRGNSTAFVTAAAALEKFWTSCSLIERTKHNAQTVGGRLDEMAALVPGSQLRGRGMFQGLDVGSGDLAGAICRRAFDLGLVVETSGARDQVVKVLAPLTTPAAQLDEGLDILVQATTDAVDTIDLRDGALAAGAPA